MTKPIHVIGAGLAGSEAAWQAAQRAIVEDYGRRTGARRTPEAQ